MRLVTSGRATKGAHPILAKQKKAAVPGNGPERDNCRGNNDCRTKVHALNTPSESPRERSATDRSSGESYRVQGICVSHRLEYLPKALLFFN